eukprot:89803-Alexandrium_andersonii.AAC.1
MRKRKAQSLLSRLLNATSKHDFVFVSRKWDETSEYLGFGKEFVEAINRISLKSLMQELHLADHEMYELAVQLAKRRMGAANLM